MNNTPFNLLGDSLVRQEHKGDFQAARALAETQLAQAQRARDVNAELDASIARGIVHLMQDEIRAAQEIFVAVQQRAPNDAIRQFRALTYELFALSEQYNTFADDSGATAVELTPRWSVEKLEPYSTRRDALAQQCADASVQTEAWLVHTLYFNFRVGQAVLDMNRYTPTPGAEQILQFFLKNSQQLLASGDANNIPIWSALGAFLSADLHHRAQNENLATQFLARAAQAYERANDSVGAANCLMTLGDWHCAPFSSPLSWNFALRDSSSEASFLAVQHEAEEFTRPTDAALKQAQSLYTQAQAAFQHGNGGRGLAALQLRNGYLAMLQDDFEKAIEYTQNAFEKFTRAGDFRNARLATTHHIMASIGAGKMRDVVERAQQIGAAGAAGASFSSTLSMGILLNRFARHCWIRRGDFDRALVTYQAAHALYVALGAEINATQSLVDQGMVYQALGDRAGAITCFEEASERYAQSKLTYPALAENLQQRELKLLTNLYDTYLVKTDADGMERTAARLQTLLPQFAPELNTQATPDVALSNFALSQLASGHIQQAAVLVPLYRARSAKADGDAARAARQFAQAESALALVQGGDRAWLAVALFAEQERFQDAANAVREYLAAGGANAGFVGGVVEQMARASNEYGAQEAPLPTFRTHDLAFDMFVRVKAYSDAREQFDVLNKLGGVEWWKQDRRPWSVLANIGEMHEGLQEFDAALEAYTHAIAEFETRRSSLTRDELKTTFAGDKNAQYLYFQAARVAMKTKNYERAFEFIERGKGRALLDLMAQRAAQSKIENIDNATLRAWRQASAQLALQRELLTQAREAKTQNSEQIASLKNQVERAEFELNRLERELTRSDANFLQDATASADTMSVEQVALLLPPDTALIEYAFLDNDFLLWTIDHTGLKQATHASIDARELTRFIIAFHAACTRASSTNVMTLGKKLAEYFIEPCRPTLQANKQLILVPYGAAHRLAFQALPFGDAPLLATHGLSYLPSASTLQFLADAPSMRSAKMLVVGNPTGDLYYSENEAEFVAALFEVAPLLGAQVQKDVVMKQLSQANLIHLATHGTLSSESPLLSAIALADEQVLTLLELMGLHLDADLVVMSACSTGEGETTAGDDILGLTRGLVSAGARSAIVSLWQVDDASTGLLMHKFYQALRDHVPPARALQYAANELRKLSAEQIDAALENLQQGVAEKIVRPRRIIPASQKKAEQDTITFENFEHPYFWAPFVLAGVGAYAIV